MGAAVFNASPKCIQWGCVPRLQHIDRTFFWNRFGKAFLHRLQSHQIIAGDCCRHANNNKAAFGCAPALPQGGR